VAADADVTARHKAELRRVLLAARAARPAAAVEAARAAIADIILARLAALDRPAACVGGYLPLRTEPGSFALLAGIAAGGARVLVPVLLTDRDLDWAGWSAAGGVGEAAGIDAIEAASVVLVPALAVDASGMRLGRGGGSYDRALARVAAGTRVVALLYDDELVESVPSDSWDLAVTDVVTPSGWYELIGGPGNRRDMRAR
jgi:5-formyltetrahydrofolate cyclo-ligase